MTGIRLIQVDAFAQKPFSGNPAAVCFLDHDVDDAWMQSVAAEMNLSETAFVRSTDNDYELRWFTPLTEVDLCGHATMASAHAMWTEGIENEDSIQFSTRSGRLTCTRIDDQIEMDFPAKVSVKVDPISSLAAAIGAAPLEFRRNEFDFLLVVETELELRSLTPDFRALQELDARGVIVTSPSDSSEFDFVSRFFAPAAGVNEDPVTGSAHCCLAPYWSERLKTNQVVGYQASKRGGTVQCRVEGDRVVLGGKAVTVMRGELVE